MSKETMKELAKKKKELIEIQQKELEAQREAFLDGYRELKAETGFELVPERRETPEGVRWYMHPCQIKEQHAG